MTEEQKKPTEHPLTIPGAATPIAGTNPVVILGPNGVGKSRLMRQAIKGNPGRFISAQRRTYLNDRLQSLSAKQAANEIYSHYNSAHSSPWEFSNEVDSLFSRILGQHFSALYQNNAAAQKGETAKAFIDDTTVANLEKFWKSVFPNRSISFSDFSPVAYPSAEGKDKGYPAKSMSDGERSCLYLAAR